jgi:hypothetical protein
VMACDGQQHHGHPGEDEQGHDHEHDHDHDHQLAEPPGGGALQAIRR